MEIPTCSIKTKRVEFKVHIELTMLMRVTAEKCQKPAAYHYRKNPTWPRALQNCLRHLIYIKYTVN